MRNENLSSDRGNDRILLIGKTDSIFLDADAVIRRLPCEVKANISDAVETAAKNKFVAIVVVMSGVSAKLDLALKSLREVTRNAKIILLAKIYEEPMAMRLVDSACNGTALADDYLICPVQTNKFYECVMPVTKQQAEGVGTSEPDITRERVRQLEKLATEDELTGLKNRRYIWEFSRQIMEHSKKRGRRVTLLIFDIDNFKHYNDVYGHLAGDEVLKQAAVLMQRCCRGHDVVGRVGGDEFAVVFWDDPRRGQSAEETERRFATADHPKEAIFIAKRFRKELKKTELPQLGPEGRGVLTISGGLASFPRDGSTIDKLFEEADKALLEAKRCGKNRIYLLGSPEGDISEIE